MRWTLPTLRVVRAAVERGETDHHIGAALGVTRDSIRRARKRYGIPAKPRQPSKVNTDELAAMIAANTPDAVCARHFGVSAQTICNHRRALGVVRPGRVPGWDGAAPVSTSKAHLIRAAAAHGWTGRKLMRHFGVGPARLKRILAER